MRVFPFAYLFRTKPPAPTLETCLPKLSSCGAFDATCVCTDLCHDTPLQLKASSQGKIVLKDTLDMFQGVACPENAF